MNFPTIFDWLERLDFLKGLPAVYGVLIAAVIILIAWDWRVTLLALSAQYLMVGFLFVDLLDPRLVTVKVLTGQFACLMLYLTARQVNWGRLPVDVTEEEVDQLAHERRVRVGRHLLPSTATFRTFLALMMILIVLTMSQRPGYLLPAIPADLIHLNMAIYALGGLGLLGMGLSSEPWQVGTSTLLFLTGFELYYSALEQSVAVLAMLAAVTLAVTLAIAYLTQARHAIPSLVD
jgi:hypothetical protein